MNRTENIRVIVIYILVMIFQLILIVNAVCYKEENTGVLIKEAGKEEYKEELCYYMNDKIKSEENKALLVVSVDTLIDYETIDSLATEITKFYKLMKKEDRKIILEIYTLKSRENILGEYEIYNRELKKIKLTEDIRYVEDIIENLKNISGDKKMRIEYEIGNKKYYLEVEFRFGEKNSVISIHMDNYDMLKLCYDYDPNVLTDLSQKLKGIY